MKVCPYCGKQGLDFDRATDGVECKKPVVYSPAVGDWGCVFSVENRSEEGAALASLGVDDDYQEEVENLHSALVDRERQEAFEE